MRNKTNASRLRGRASLLPILIVLLAALILAGCGGTAAPEETPAPVYALRYYLGDKLLQTQSLAEGEYPTHLDLSFPGLTFAGWRTDGGAPVQPEQTPITGDVDYHAVIYPLLTNHVPYLFPDEDGFLHPDAPLDMQALDAAIRALAAPEAVGYLPALPATEEPLTPDKLNDTLRVFFPAPQVDAAMAAYRGNDVIARRDAAVIFNDLLGRSGAETVTLRRDAFRAPDVLPGMAEYWDLTEAAVSHAVDPWGESWDSCAIPAAYAPGFLPLRGRLYYIGGNGAILTDTEVGGFTFGADGVYASGSPDLDARVTEILASLAAENPDADRLGLLRLAYDYSRDSFIYFRKPALDFGADGWQTEYALAMLSEGRGNCYNYAAVFWALARGLGYDAKAYSGRISGDPHGWVEIDIDGETYLFDPELEMAAIQRGITNQSRFMMTKQAAAMRGNYLKKA